jgi:hypothetical protein
MKSSRVLSAILAAIFMAAPFIGLSYAAWHWLGLPSLPFDAFDALSRLLPRLRLIPAEPPGFTLSQPIYSAF